MTDTSSSFPTLTLCLQRFINAPVEAIYAAFSEPAHLSRWFTSAAQADLRVGGHYSNADGDHGRFLALEAPHRIEFTWENEKHCPGTIVRVTFEAQPQEQVKVMLEHSHLRTQQDYEDMQGGWSWALDSLKSYLETGQPIKHEEWLKSQG